MPQHFFDSFLLSVLSCCILSRTCFFYSCSCLLSRCHCGFFLILNFMCLGLLDPSSSYQHLEGSGSCHALLIGASSLAAICYIALDAASACKCFRSGLTTVVVHPSPLQLPLYFMMDLDKSWVQSLDVVVAFVFFY